LAVDVAGGIAEKEGNDAGDFGGLADASQRDFFREALDELCLLYTSDAADEQCMV
jgi:hypothetical protein